MKRKGVVTLMLCLALGTGSGMAAGNSAVKEKAVAIENTNSASTKMMMSRLQEIKALALKGNLDANQKKDLRKEVLNIKHEMKQRDPVLVISLSAALLIVLILILLAR